MSEAPKIRRNSIFSFLSIAVRLVTNVLLFMLIARFYGAELFGQFTFAHTLATIFILFADFGFDVLLTTEIARNRKEAQTIFQTFFSLKFVFCFLALIGMWIFAFVFQISYSSRILVLIFSFFVFFTALNNFIFALFKGYEQLSFETWISFLVNGSLLIILIILSFLNVSIYLIAITFVLTRLFGMFLSLRIVRKVLPEITFRFNFQNWVEVRSQVFIFGMQLLFGNLFFQIDTLLLSFFKNDAEVGIYQAVFKLMALPLVIPDVLINALLPVLSRFHSENKVRWQKVAYLLNKILVMISLPISVIAFVFADEIIKIIYVKNEFFRAIPILRIFALIIFVRFFFETYALLLTTSKNQKKRMIVVVCGTFFNLVLNCFMIPRYGAFGASIISLITNSMVGLGYLSFCSKMIDISFVGISIIIPIILSIILSMIAMNYSFAGFWIESTMLFTFISVSIYLFVFTKEEKNLLLAEQKIISLFSKNK